VYSVWVDALLSDDGLLTYEVTHPDGTHELVVINLNDLTWTAIVDQPPGSSDPDCEVGGTATASGPGLPAAGGDEPPAAGEEPPADAGQEPTTTADTGDEASGGDAGVPWVPIGIARALLATTAVVVIYRTTTKTKERDCEPERQAYATARVGNDQAMKVRDHWLAEHQAAREAYAEQENKANNPFDAPNRSLGYP
jgi:hypothetical protein